MVKSSRSFLRRFVRNIASTYNRNGLWGSWQLRQEKANRGRGCRAFRDALWWPMIPRKLSLLTILCMVGLATFALADEGMWLFNAPPTKQLKEKYNFEPTKAWLDHLQKSSVRFNSGGSGSFISGTGLVITNHHVGADTLQKISDEQHNYLRDGFYAHDRSQEKKAVDLELNVLMSIEDVTER